MPPIIVAIALTTTFCLAYMVRSLMFKPSNHALRAAVLGILAMLAAIGLGMITSGAESRHPIAAGKWWLSVTQHAMTMTSLYLSMVFFLYSVHRPARATALAMRHGAVLLAAIAAAIGFASLASPEDYSAGFVTLYTKAPFSSLYLAVYGGYLTAMITTVAALSFRWSRLAGDPWIRRGMLVGAVGNSIGVVYGTIKVTYILLGRADITPAVGEMTLTGPLILVAVPLGLIGLTVPGWGPRLTAVINWVRRHRAHRQLFPLWSALTEQFPHTRMALGRSRFDWRDLDLRLHLRVIQIWDARRALTDYCDPAVHEAGLARGRATGLTADALAAFAEASMVTAALRCHREGTPVSADRSLLPTGAGEADLAVNVAWLRQVSRFFTNQDLAQLTAGPPAGTGTASPSPA